MSEPVRRRIVEILASGEHPAGLVSAAIEHEFQITRSAVSKHLRLLRETGFVVVRPEESRRLYSLTDRAIKVLLREVKALRRLWRERIAWDAPADNILRAGVRQSGVRHSGVRHSGVQHSGVRPPGYTVDASGGSRRGLRGRSASGFSRAVEPWAMPRGAD